MAAQGNAAAQFSLGRLYAEGAGVAQDDVEAARWFRLVVAQGDVDAQYFLCLWAAVRRASYANECRRKNSMFQC
jgi:hypothetical protein